MHWCSSGGILMTSQTLAIIRRLVSSVSRWLGDIEQEDGLAQAIAFVLETQTMIALLLADLAKKPAYKE